MRGTCAVHGKVSAATPDRLDLSQIATYFARYDFNFADEPPEEKQRLLRASDLLGDGGHPTVGGLLVFGIAPEQVLPQAGIQFAHFRGVELDAELLDKKKIGGSLPQQVDLALAALRSNLPIRSTIQGALRVEGDTLPDRVFRELLVNACVHRNYSITGSQIRVFLFADRAEFISPGRLPNTVRIDKLAVGTSYARNPLLVRLMENLGYMDKLGRGLPMVVREAARRGKTVTFEESGEEFRVRLPF